MQEQNYLKSHEKLGPLRGGNNWLRKASLPGSRVKGERALVWGAGMGYYKTETTLNMVSHSEKLTSGLSVNRALSLLEKRPVRPNLTRSTRLWRGSAWQHWDVDRLHPHSKASLWEQSSPRRPEDCELSSVNWSQQIHSSLSRSGLGACWKHTHQRERALGLF